MAHVEDRWKRDGRSGTGKRWRVRYTDPSGRERSKSFDRKTDADRFRKLTEADIERDRWTDPEAGNVTFREYAEGWLAIRPDDINPSTIETMERRLRLHAYPVIGGVPLKTLAARPAVLQQWRKGLPTGSASQVFGVISAVLSAAAAEERIRRNPLQVRGLVSRPRAPKRLVVSWEADRVAAVQDAMPGRCAPMVTCGADLGMRQGEILGLSPDDVIAHIRHGRAVHVQRQVKIVGNRLVFAPPPHGSERHIPLPPEVDAELAVHAKRFPPAEVTLPWKEPGGLPVTVRLYFTQANGNAMSRPVANTAWRAALRAAGVAPGRENGMHQLRHHYASTLLAGGVDIKAVSEFLGHASAAFTLETYTHLMPAAPDRARAAVAASRAQREPAADGPVTAQETS